MIFDLILAIFGGGYYAGKYLHDKSKNIRTDRAIADRRAKHDLFIYLYKIDSDPFLAFTPSNIRNLKDEFENAHENGFAVFENYRKDLEYIYDKEITTPYLHIYYPKELAMLIYADRGKLPDRLMQSTGGYVITSDDDKRLLQRVEEKFNKVTGENMRLIAHNDGYFFPEKGYGSGFRVTNEEFAAAALRPFKRLW